MDRTAGYPVEESKFSLSYYFHCVPKNDIRCQIASHIKDIVPTIMLAIGAIGNALNVVILCRKKFRNHPFLIGLIVLSVSDTLQLLLNVLSIYVIQRLDSKNPYRYCKYDCLAVTSQGTFSFYTLAILTLERMLHVRRPNLCKRIFTRRNCILVLIVAMVVIILVHVFMIFGGNENIPIHTNASSMPNETVDQFVEDQVDCLVVSLKHGAYRPILMPLLSFFANFIPLLIVCMGNILIIKVVKESRARVNGDNSRENQTQDTATKIAMTICIFFCVSTSPLFISKSVQAFVTIPLDVYPTVSLIDMFLYVAVQCNFAFNFIMYFWTGSVFREECKLFFADIKRTFLRLRCLRQ